MNTKTLLVIILIVLLLPSYNSLAHVPTPSPIPLTATSNALISQQVTLASQPYVESHQDPLFTITSQTPQLTRSNDPRVQAFNQRLNEIIQKEMKSFSDEFLLYSAKPLPNGSSLEGTYTLTAQHDDIWSFKLHFLYYY